jgi:hypothetical protein
MKFSSALGGAIAPARRVGLFWRQSASDGSPDKHHGSLIHEDAILLRLQRKGLGHGRIGRQDHPGDLVLLK